MDTGETLKIMAVLKAAYPGYYKGMAREEAMAVVGLWTELFADDPYDHVALAVKRLIGVDTKGFPPVIGQIKEQLARLKMGNVMSEQEAWGYISRAAGRSAYHASCEFDSLPRELRAIVGSADQLHRWSQTDSDQLQTVVASNVMRSYRTSLAQRKEQAVLPKQLTDLATGLLQAWEGGI